MAIKKILVEPNKLLRKVSQPVKEINKEITFGLIKFSTYKKFAKNVKKSRFRF